MVDARTYIKVHDGIMDHPKIEVLSDRAFRLLIGNWCWCARHLTDGKIPRSAWLKRGTPKARAELIAAKLAEDCGEFVVMHDYTEHQRSAAEVEAQRETKRRAGAIGNHQRWHTGPDATPDSACEYCVTDHEPSPQDPSHNRSQVRSQTNSQVPSQNNRKTIAKTENKQKNKNPPSASKEVTQERARDPLRAPAIAHETLPDPHPVPGITGAHAGDAYRLVDRAIGRNHPSAVRTALAIEVKGLLRDGIDPELITATLELWLTKPNCGPRVLPSLVSEVIKTREAANRPTHLAPVTELATSDQRFQRGMRIAEARRARRLAAEQNQQQPVPALPGAAS
jgi:hypothetical protein